VVLGERRELVAAVGLGKRRRELLGVDVADPLKNINGKMHALKSAWSMLPRNKFAPPSS
jgi:hypothetical protein